VGLPLLAEHAGAVGGIIAAIFLGLRYGSDAVLRLIAGIAAIACRDSESSRAKRALDVLRLLRRDRQSGPDSSL
jgi:hypothetical protein